MSDPHSDSFAELGTRGILTLRHVLDAAALDPADVLLLRHTYTPGGLLGPEDLTPQKILAYARTQVLGNKVGSKPPRVWLNFIAAGGRRSRFLHAHENRGEVCSERTATRRFFDLRRSPVFSSFDDRLVIEWTRDTVNWAKTARSALDFPVVEISGASRPHFPGFERLLLSLPALQAVVEDSRYGHWQTALASVKGIYLITDTRTGRLYVGKADGSNGFLGRWSAYAQTGHGGNVALIELDGLDPENRKSFQFSILRVFGPGVTGREIDDAEEHFKKVLLSRQFGLNRN